MSRRRKFTREFPFDCAQGEVSAVKMVNEQGCSVAETAKNLGVDANSVRGWVAKLSAEPGMTPVGEGALMAEVRQLRKENARLLMERESLKSGSVLCQGAAMIFGFIKYAQGEASRSGYYAWLGRRDSRPLTPSRCAPAAR